MDQILAIIWLRFKHISYKLRTLSGIANLISTILLLISGTALSLAMAAGFGILSYYALETGDELTLRVSFYIIFYVCFVSGVLLPILMAAGNPGFDAMRFLIFPISRRKLYGITLSACFGSPEHLFYYPTLLAVFSASFIAIGSSAWIGLWILLFLLFFYIVWSHALVLLLQTIMRRRRIREIIVLAFFMILIFLSLVPALSQTLISKSNAEGIPFAIPLVSALAKAGMSLPPSLAGEGYTALGQGNWIASFQNIFGLSLWILVGMALGYYVFINFHLGEKGKIQKKKPLSKTEQASTFSFIPFSQLIFSFLPIDLLAVTYKDIRYLFRSVLGRFNLLMMPVFVMIIVFIFGKQVDQPFIGMEPKNLLLFGMLIYVTMFSNNMINNAFAWEGTGIKSYFLSPVSLQRILAGKNLSVWIYNLLLFAICIFIWSVLMKVPDPFTFITGLLVFSVSLLIFTIAGNIISILFPAKRDISSMRNTPSQMAILLSLLSLSVSVVIISFCLFLPILLDIEFMQPLLLAFFLAVLIIIYSLSMNFSARLLSARREKMIDALKEK